MIVEGGTHRLADGWPSEPRMAGEMLAIGEQGQIAECRRQS